MPRSSVKASGFAIVATAAAMWGTDALFRRGLALEAPAASVVFWEHTVLAVLFAPLVWRGRSEIARLSAREWAAVIAIGAGASVAATVLFTQALAGGDPTTPLLLQKIQPILAITLAALLLGERLAPRFAVVVVPALLGVLLITFPDPGSVTLAVAADAALAVGAAALWALGTVLGRLLAPALSFATLTGLRFLIGLPVAAVAAAAVGAGLGGPTGDQVPALLGLSLVPGALAMGIYYFGLRRTPASLATLAELAFPLAAILVGRLAFGDTLTATQWAGVAVLSGTVVGVSLAAQQGSEAIGVTAPRLRRVVAGEAG